MYAVIYRHAGEITHRVFRRYGEVKYFMALLNALQFTDVSIQWSAK